MITFLFFVFTLVFCLPSFKYEDEIECYENRRKVTVTNNLGYGTDELLLDVDIMEIENRVHSNDYYDIKFVKEDQTDLDFWIEGSFKDYVDEYNLYGLSKVSVWIDYLETVANGETVEFYMYFGCGTQNEKQKSECDWDGNFYFFTNWNADCNGWEQTTEMNGYFLKDDGINEWGYTNSDPNVILPYHYRPISDGDMTEKASEFPLYGERITIQEPGSIWDNAISHEHKHHVSYLLEHDEFPEYIERSLCFSHNLRLRQGLLIPVIGELDTTLDYNNYKIYRSYKYMKAESYYNNTPSDSSTTGGAHNHSYSHNISYAAQNYRLYELKYQLYVDNTVNFTRWYHQHILSFTTNGDDTQTLNPEALKVYYWINQKTHHEIHPEMIIMIDKEPPLGWNTYTTSYDKYLVGSPIEEMLGEYGSKYHHHKTDTSFQTPDDIIYLDDYFKNPVFSGLVNFSVSGYHHRHMCYPNRTQPEARNELPYFNVKYYTRKYLEISHTIGEIEDLLLCEDNYYPYGACDVTICYGVFSNLTNTCSGNGKCTDYNDCECNIESNGGTYGGNNCELNDCYGFLENDTVNVCSGRGSCDSPNVCTCNEGYVGNKCELPKCNGIISNNSDVCSGRGSCVDSEVCVCDDLSKYGGKYCEYQYCDNILSNNTETVCNGNGDCVEPDVCVCFEENGSTWVNTSFCEIPICNNLLPGEIGVCNDRGDCIRPNNCNCTVNGYGGDDCQYFICYNYTEVDERVCSNGNGNCTYIDTCECQDGIWGDNCQYSICYGIESENETVCGGIGECVSTDTCVCGDYYGGDECELVKCNLIVSTDPNVCNGNGICEDVNSCNCDKSYGGDYCELYRCNSILETDPEVCNGNGNCVGVDDCNCSTGYSGTFCQTSSQLTVGHLIGIISGGVVLLLFVLIVFVVIVVCISLCVMNSKKKTSKNDEIVDKEMEEKNDTPKKETKKEEPKKEPKKPTKKPEPPTKKPEPKKQPKKPTKKPKKEKKDSSSSSSSSSNSD